MTTPSRSGILAVLMPVGYDVYFGSILAGVTDAAYENGLRLSIASTRHEHAREVQLLAQLSDMTGGALIILPEPSGDELERALTDDYPVVVIDPLLPLGNRVPSVAAGRRAPRRSARRWVGGANSDGTGLVGLADRLAVLDGRLEVDSPRGGGTCLAAAIPLARFPE